MTATPVGPAGTVPKVPSLDQTRRRWFLSRGFALFVTCLTLYLLAPGLLEVLSSWDQVSQLEPWWLLAVGACQVTAWTFGWALQRLALRTDAWLPVVTSQMAGNAAGRVVPGGVAAAGALQFRLLRSAGVSTANASVGLAAAGVLQLATTMALPLVVLPVVVFGAPIERGLLSAALSAVALFVLLVFAAFVFVKSERPLRLVGDVVDGVKKKLRWARPPGVALAETLVLERDSLKTEFGRSWLRAVALAMARAAFDYLSLLTAVAAFDVDARAALILLAFAGASLLGMIPLSPGGLGFVEAGLAGLLLLAGVPAAESVSITLLYRLFSFWLPIPLGLLAGAIHQAKFPAI